VSRVRWIALGLLVAAFLAAGVGASFLVGYKSGRAGADARTLGRALLVRLGLPVPAALRAETQVPKLYESVLLTLETAAIPVPTQRPGGGGGLTSFGAEVLLLTHDGRLLSTTGSAIEEIAAGIPDNGFEAHRRASESEAHGHMTFSLGNHRYNDVLFYESPQARGLAISYTEYFERERCYTTTIATLALAEHVVAAAQVRAEPSDWRILYRSQPCLPLKTQMRAIEGHMAGGRMAFKAPSSLYLANGDYHWDGMYAPDAIAQLPDREYGKVMEIDVGTGTSRVFSVGHRNPQGIAFDTTGQLWVVEQGPRGGDELNRVELGQNYGWPLETLGTLYSGFPVPGALSFGRHDSYAAPAFAWLPSVAASGLDVVEGFHGSWDGDLLMASLAAESLFRIRVGAAGVQFTEQIRLGKRIRYVLQHTDGRLVLWTDSHELIFLAPSKRGAALRHAEEQISAKPPELAAEIRQALESCMECHSLSPGDHTNAPSLAAVYGQTIPATEFAGYSPALRSIETRWTRENLLAFLRAPQSFAPGTTMPATPHDRPDVLEGLVDVLAAISDAPLE
jgi:cytochrome c2